MVPEIDPQNLTQRQIDLITAGRTLEGIDLSLFDYFGGPELQGACIGRMQLDEDGVLPASHYDSPEERLHSLVLAQLLRGALRQSVPIVLTGIFDDIFALRTIEHAGGDTQEYMRSAAATVVSMLPPAYRRYYTAEFLQRFAIVAAEVASDFELGWDTTRTFAHDLATYCFAKKAIRHADAEYGTRLGAVNLERMIVGLLNDSTTLEATYAVPQEDHDDDQVQEPAWFTPYDTASRVNPYLYPPGQPTAEQIDLLQHQLAHEVPEKYIGAQRQRALHDGDLIDLSPYASGEYFLCPVAVEKMVLDGLGFTDLPPDTGWEDLLLSAAWYGAAEHPAWKSYNYLASGFDGEHLYVAVVAGMDELECPVLTVQYVGAVTEDMDEM